MWWSGRALRLHLTLAVMLAGFALLFRWQLHRALGGNELSWAYTVEWPIFAFYAVFMWWKLLHEDLATARPPRFGRERKQRRLNDEAEELTAYNAYLARLQNEDVERQGEDGPSAAGERGS
jgi:hypothetical protein